MIFISYRIEDSKHLAWALADRLKQHFGTDAVFLDKQDINTGKPWTDEIEAALSKAVVVLAVIGQRWLKACDEHGRRRIDIEDDVLANELITALERKIEIIPLFIDELKPLSLKAYPERLAGIAALQGLEFDISRDLTTLLAKLEAIPGLHKKNLPPGLKDVLIPSITASKPRNIPSSINKYFKGREPFLEQIHKVLSESGQAGQRRAAAITAPVATVHGLGGIGKTRVAVEYAHRYAEEYTALLFVPADSPANLDANLAKLCHSDVLDLPEKDAKELDIQTATALRWLKQNPGWFLIFDNADTKEAVEAVENRLPQLAQAGRILITSRIGVWPNSVESLPLDVLAEQDAADFLILRTEKNRCKASDDPAQALALANALGYLALALEQAGAYIAENGLTFAEYQIQWQRQHDEVIQWYDPRVMKYPMSVAQTWLTSFKQLTEPARQLLQCLAWFAPDPIPKSILDTQLQIADAAGNPGDSPEAHGQLHWQNALANLAKYSLVTRSKDAPTFTIHRLVQDVTRGMLKVDTAHNALKSALNWINTALVADPQDVRSWPVLDPLAPHALACAQFADQVKIADPTARLMSQLGTLYSAKAQHAEAEPLIRRALILSEHSFGKVHPNVASVLNNLAALLQATNRLAEAEPLMRRALEIGEQSFGNDHPNVAVCLNNLSLLLKATNRLAEAEPMYRRALAIDEQSLGKDHPAVASDLNNLAALLKDTNRLAQAEPMYRRALAIDEHSFGKDHPNVARGLNNLALLLQDTNRLAEAEPLMRRALPINEQSLGKDHPDVASVLSNLALLLQATNRLDEAEPLIRRALAIDEQSFGKDHPYVARDLNNLATLLQDTNRVAEAEPLMRRALAIDEQSYGKDHPKVAIRLNNLALLLQDTNRIAEAEPLMRRSLEIFETAYGPEHPVTANGWINLGRIMMDLGDEAQAESMSKKALLIWRQSQSPNDPRTGKAHQTLGLIEAHRQNKVTAKEHFQAALRLLNHAPGSYPRELEQVKEALAGLQ
jgi:tetratricopeptide (TPR) repeat protein